MAKKKATSTPAEAAAGEQNLNNWLAEHPSGGNLRHGMYSVQIRQRYSDRRTSEGAKLASIMKGLREDLGGNGHIPTAAHLLLDSIKSKIIVILQIGKFVDRQIDLIDQKTGELLPCLGRNFTIYTESLRRDLEALAAMAGKKKAPDLQDYLKASYGKDENIDRQSAE